MFCGNKLFVILLFCTYTEQDSGLDALSHVLSRQKQMALDIGNEVDYQDGILLC